MKRLLVALSLCFLMAAGPATAAETEDKKEQDVYRSLELFANVFTLIMQHYVDEVEGEQVVSGAINGMLSSLDPHSAYMQPDDFRELEEETSGRFTGIGVEVTIRDNVLTAVTPIEGTPAFRAGIRSGDQIVRIDGELTKNMTLLDAVKKMRGEVGSKVTVGIQRKGWASPRDFVLQRESIPLVSVRSIEMEPGYVYIRVSNFQTSTAIDLKKELSHFRQKGQIRGLVLDLRNNPGGLLDQAVKVADAFLDKGVIVTTKGRGEQEQVVFKAHMDREDNSFPMIVLVNSGSASGSEIVAGALQDHKRATIMGTVTFGKGSVQTLLPLQDGAGIRLTTAKYYTPSGASIQARGITPDKVVPLTASTVVPKDVSANANKKSKSKTVRESDLPHHLRHESGNDAVLPADLEDINQEERFAEMVDIQQINKRLEQDNQLRAALTLLKNWPKSGVGKSAQEQKSASMFVRM